MPSISLPAAIIGSAVVGTGAAIYSGSQASKAAGKAAQAQQQAADAATAEQRRQFDVIQANNEPFRQIGLSSLGAVAKGFGLPVSMTGAPAAAGTAPATAGGGVSGVSMTGIGVANPSGGFHEGGTVGAGSPVIDMHPQADGSYAATQASGQLSDAQVQQILKDRPDVAAEYQKVSNGGTAHLTGGGGIDSPEQFARYWYDQVRPAAGDNYSLGATQTAQVPATIPAQPDDGAYHAPPGYTDPTATAGYTMTGRPTPAPLDVSEAAYDKSPGYDFRLNEGMKALDHVAAAGGGLMSGSRLKAATRYGQDYATADYNNWRDYTTGEYNLDRSRSDGLYQDDRSNLNSRYDTRNNQLMQLAGFGSAATASNNNAASSFATNVGNNLMTAGNAKAGGYINSANATTGAVNNLMTVGSNLAGRYMGGGYGSTGGYGGLSTGGWNGSFNLTGA